MTEDKKDENIESSNENEENIEKVDNQPSVDENFSGSSDDKISENQNLSENQEISVSNEETNVDSPNETTEHQVIHKKDGRLHIYVRQDKYKGELKSKNWVGRLYIDGKQKISSSGTQNLDDAIPILENQPIAIWQNKKDNKY